MKESIGNALLFNIIIVFVIILLAFFLGSLSYTKAFKVNNRIVEEIEKEGESAGRQFTDFNQAENAYDNAKDNIEKWLNYGNEGKGIGYRKNTSGGVVECKYTPSEDYAKGKLVSDKSNNYEYCVYRVDTCSNSGSSRCGVYYHVITYMYFDVPIIDSLLKLPVNGETRTFEVMKN